MQWIWSNPHYIYTGTDGMSCELCMLSQIFTYVVYTRPVLYLQVKLLGVLCVCKPIISIMYGWQCNFQHKNTKYSNTTHSQDGKLRMEFGLIDFNKTAEFLPITMFAYETMAVFSFHELNLSKAENCHIYPLCIWYDKCQVHLMKLACTLNSGIRPANLFSSCFCSIHSLNFPPLTVCRSLINSLCASSLLRLPRAFHRFLMKEQNRSTHKNYTQL